MGEIQLLECVNVSFDALGLAPKRIKLAVHKPNRRYYVWIEDYDFSEQNEEEFTDSNIKAIPLSSIPSECCDVFKDKKTALSLYRYYISVLSEVNSNTVDYFETKEPIWAYAFPSFD